MTMLLKGKQGTKIISSYRLTIIYACTQIHSNPHPIHAEINHSELRWTDRLTGIAFHRALPLAWLFMTL